MTSMFKKPQSADDYLKWIIGGVSIFIVLVMGFFVWQESQNALEPKPVTQKDQAKSMKDLGRDHISNIGGQTYNSNPPTSGRHFASWAKRGVYDRVLSDGYLIHALEHGYVILSYNCGEKGKEKEKVVYKSGDPLTELKTDVQGAMSAFTPEKPPAEEVKLPAAFGTDACKTLVTDLSQFLKEYQRIIVVPRPTLDTQIAVTAWTKIDKVDTFDADRIRAFVAAYHNKGPEQTVE